MAKLKGFLVLLPMVFLLYSDIDVAAAVAPTGARRTMGAEPGELVYIHQIDDKAPAPSALSPAHVNAAKDLPMTPASPPVPVVCMYTVVTETANERGAGTDSTISLGLQNRDDEEIYFESLDTPVNNFEPGCTDTFRAHGNCVSRLCKMTLYTDDSGWFPSWYPTYVEVFVTPNTATSASDYHKWDVLEWLPTEGNSRSLVRDHCST